MQHNFVRTFIVLALGLQLDCTYAFDGHGLRRLANMALKFGECDEQVTIVDNMRVRSNGQEEEFAQRIRVSWTHCAELYSLSVPTLKFG